MDWLFSIQIPSSSKSRLVIRPWGKTFISGIASSYRTDQYDQNILGKHITEEEFGILMKDMNRVLGTYWPCSFCVWFGYVFAPFTFGGSFYAPNLCVQEAKSGLIAAIERQNRLKLREKSLCLTYVQGFSMSWLELKIISPTK